MSMRQIWGILAAGLVFAGLVGGAQAQMSDVQCARLPNLTGCQKRGQAPAVPATATVDVAIAGQTYSTPISQILAGVLGQPNGAAKLDAFGAIVATGGKIALPLSGEVFLGQRPQYPESNTVVFDKFAPGINTREGGLYIYRDTYGTFGQATVGAFIANSGGSGMPQISGFVTAAEAGSGSERGSAALYLENNAPAALAVVGATFDRTHAYLPAPLTADQAAKYGKPGTFLEVKMRGPLVGPYSAQVVAISPDRRTITVTGWWIRGNPAAGQDPNAGAAAGPYTLNIGVVSSVWGSASVVGISPTSYATSAAGSEVDFYNDSGSFTFTRLSDVLGDMPRMAGHIIGAGTGGISAGYWALASGPAYLRAFAAQNVRNDGAGFVYMDQTSTGTAFYSGQTAGSFLKLAPNDGTVAFNVDAGGNIATIGGATIKGGIVQIGNSAVASSSNRVDFRSAGLGADWDSRIIATGGGASSGQGVLTLAASSVAVTGGLAVTGTIQAASLQGGAQSAANGWNLFGVPAVQYSTINGANAIVGIAENKVGGGYQPTGVTGYGRVSVAGASVFGLFGRADLYTSTGTATNEVNSFNWSGIDPTGTLPPDRSLGTSSNNTIALTVAAGGNKPSSIGIQLGREGGSPQPFRVGVYMNPDAATQYGMMLDATSTSFSALPLLVKGAGSGYVSQFQYVGTYAPNNAMLAFVDASSTVRGAIRQDGGLTNSGINSIGALAVTGNTVMTDPRTTATNNVVMAATANSFGMNLKLTGDGATTPSKTLRVTGGTFGIINDAYTSVILSLSDAGNLALTGGLASAGTVQLTGLPTCASAPSSGNVCRDTSTSPATLKVIP